jgi:putative peptidoglycan lipid II flippase
MAAIFGSSRLQDIFQVAFELPNTVRRVMGEGALSAFIVPLLGERRRRDGEAAGWEFFNRAANFVTFVALLLALAGMFFAHDCFLLFGGLGLKLGGGRLSPEGLRAYVDIGTRMTRIMFPYIIMLTLASMMMGACHSLRKFGTPSLGAVMLNLTMIAVGWTALRFEKQAEPTAIALCWAVLAGAALRLALMVPTLWRAGWRWRPVLTLRDRELIRLMNMMGLAILTMMISQVNIMVSNQFAMYMGAGIKSSLVFSQRLIQFPMALTATAVATGMLPQLAAYLLEGRGRELRDLMAFTKRMEITLVNPAMLGLVVFGAPILQLIYEHGRWTPQATHNAYVALLFYAPGLLPMGWMRLLTPLYYARKDLLTPLKAALIGMVFNVLFNGFFAMFTPMRQGGLALANTLAMFVNYGALAWYLRGELHAAERDERPRIAETFWKSMAASALACGAGWAVYRGLLGWLGTPHGTMARAALLLPMLAAVAALYFVLARLIHVPDVRRATELALEKLRLNKP